jgi:hypothetical protein
LDDTTITGDGTFGLGSGSVLVFQTELSSKNVYGNAKNPISLVLNGATLNFGEGSEIELLLPSEEDPWNENKKIAADVIRGTGEGTGGVTISADPMKFIDVKGNDLSGTCDNIGLYKIGSN